MMSSSSKSLLEVAVRSASLTTFCMVSIAGLLLCILDLSSTVLKS